MPSDLLALDLGTTSVRALVVSLEAGVLGRAQCPLPTAFPAPGRVEQDPNSLWESSLEVLRRALRQAKRSASDVAALGIATQRSTAMAWDCETGEALAPALGWQDQRAARLAEQLREQGILVAGQTAAAKFAWWMRENAAIRRAADAGRLRLGTPDVWLHHKLSRAGESLTEPGQASSTGLYQLDGGDWNAGLAEALGVPLGALPKVVDTAGAAAEAAPEWLGAAVPMAARAGDQQAACFAQGVHAPGQAKLTLGTAAILDVHDGGQPSALCRESFPIALWRLPGLGEAFAREGIVVTAGAALDWLVDVGILSRPGEVDRIAAETSGSDGVVFVPALQGLGHPWPSDAARGLIGGLTRGSSRAQLARALLEGVAQRCADLCEGLQLADCELRVDGGLARSELLVQWIADFSGCPVLRAVETETTALGAAQLAGLGVGVLPDLAACRALAPAPERFEPSLHATRRDRARTRWRELIQRRVL